MRLTNRHHVLLWDGQSRLLSLCSEILQWLKLPIILGSSGSKRSKEATGSIKSEQSKSKKKHAWITRCRYNFQPRGPLLIWKGWPSTRAHTHIYAWNVQTVLEVNTSRVSECSQSMQVKVCKGKHLTSQPSLPWFHSRTSNVLESRERASLSQAETKADIALTHHSRTAMMSSGLSN